MSGIDPFAAIGADAVAAAQAAFQEAALNLGVEAELLQAKISVGDLISATVLPPENGADRLSLLGQTVAAQLPPGVHPGETVLLQVNALRGNQILVRNLGPVDPQDPPRTIDLEASAPPENAPGSAVLATPEARPAVSPPRELFVAASVLPTDAPRNDEAPPPPLRQVVIEPAEAPFQARIAFSRLSPPVEVERGSRVEPPPRIAVPPPLVARDAPPPAPAAPLHAVPRTVEGSLLARLRVPISIVTLAAARIVSDAAKSLPRAYARLDAVLARIPAGDARVGPLRTMLTFLGKIDPGNARALPEQIASFVSNVVTGPEAKLAQIARASVAPLDLPTAQAQIVERAAAIDHDVKTALLSLVQSPPQGAPPQLAQVVTDALAVTTGVQLHALSAQQSDPNTIVIALPAVYYEGGRATQLRIAREKPQGRGGLDADNFHIAFVLDTQSLGTVAIDMQTVGRAVSVSVKTERRTAADSFRATLADLRGRLEQLRYRVSSIDADVIPPRSAAATQSQPPAADPRPSANVDMRA
jgi:hypothetical protein